MNKYGKITAEFKNIPEEEPLFLLRGKDILAPVVISQYASLLRATGYGIEQGGSESGNDDDRLRAMADEVDNIAAAMIAWQSEYGARLPD